MGDISFNNNNGPIHIRHVPGGPPRKSILGRLVEIIAEANSEEPSLDRLPTEVESKVVFNNLKAQKWVVDAYLASPALVDESIKELNRLILNGSTKLKRQMNLFYKTALAKYGVALSPFDLERLRANSDLVVADVMEQTKEFIKSSSDVGDGFFAEDIEFGVALIVSYSIIECVVLENEHAHS